MDSDNGGTMFDPPRPEVGPPLLPPPESGAPPAPFPPQFQPEPSGPEAVVVPTGSVGKRSRGKIVGGLVAVVALVGAGGFAVSKIVSGADGGAATPAEVGTRLMDALEAEDALGVVDLLLPGEREMMRQPLIDVVDNLKRLGVADKAASLDKVGGLDIAFADVQVQATDTNVDDISDIRVTASSTSSVDGATLPIGDLLIDEAFGGDRPVPDSAPQTSDIDWTLATVKRDGRWYLSAFYSIAENARDHAQDIPENPLEPRGADTPDGAVQAIFDAVDGLDLKAMIAALNPNEAEALQRYAPMFVDDVQGGIDDLDAKIKFSDTKFTVTGEGDRRSVAIDGFTMTTSANGEDVTIEVKDGCIVVTSSDTNVNTCKSGSSIDQAIGVLGLDDNDDVKSLVTTFQDAFADMKTVGVTVQQVDGQWYVSPVGTYADIFLAVMGALDKNELTGIIDAAKKVSTSVLTGGLFGSPPPLSIDDTSVGGDSNNGDAGDAGGLDGFDACFDQTEYAGFSACVLAGIDDGSIDESFVAPYYRFADCGVGESYWSGDVYSLSDADFIAFANAAAPCFQKHIDDGSISQFELPYELARPDCLEGKNWYNVSDPDYTKRVFDCAS